MKKLRNPKVLAEIVLFALLLLVCIVDGIESKKYDMSYSEVISAIKNGEVASVEVIRDEENISAELAMNNGSKKKAYVPSEEAIASEIATSGQEVNFRIRKVTELYRVVNLYVKFFRIVFAVGLILLPLAIRNAANEEGNITDIIGISKYSKKKSQPETNCTLDDVAGIDSEKEAITQIIDFLKNPDQYHKMGAKIPKGVLLSGPPGVGKTLLAKAIAGEAGCSFFSATGADFEEELVGVGASRVRSLFEKATKQGPSIVFIDEIDAIGAARYEYHTHAEQTLNQLLALMDGFDSNSNVIVIAATNYCDILDKALLRRFERKINIPIPDLNARKKIIAAHSKNKKISEEVSLDEIAKKTVGFSGAGLANLLNEAAILATNRDAKSIEAQDVDEAFARIVVGIKNNDSITSGEERYQSAIHEAGHAIVAKLQKPKTQNLGISIIPRGTAGGYNLFNDDEKAFQSKQDMIAEIMVSYGGRAAEDVALGIVSTGAYSDLKYASKLAKNMAVKFAMTERLLTLTGFEYFDAKLSEEYIACAEEICKTAYSDTKKIIEDNQDTLKALADLLVQKESLSTEEIEEFFDKHKVTAA